MWNWPIFISRLHKGVALCLPLCLGSASFAAQADDNKEFLVKAAFIYNFVKFIEWPGDKAIVQQSGLDICVLGDSPLSNTASVFKDASTAKLTLALVEEKNWKNVAAHCHVVFISQSQQDRLPDIFGALKGKPVLTVSDMDGFAEHGGMIGFVTNDNKVKLEVNADAASASGLRVDAQLLEIAQRVIKK